MEFFSICLPYTYNIITYYIYLLYIYTSLYIQGNWNKSREKTFFSTDSLKDFDRHFTSLAMIQRF